MNHFNNLTPAEHERLSILVEEMAEVIGVAGKILRFGWSPTDYSVQPHVAYDNRRDLEKEIGDVRAALRRMLESGDVSEEMIQARANVKYLDRSRLHHQDKGE